jgi:hypothetical protein
LQKSNPNGDPIRLAAAPTEAPALFDPPIAPLDLSLVELIEI